MTIRSGPERRAYGSGILAVLHLPADRPGGALGADEPGRPAETGASGGPCRLPGGGLLCPGPQLWRDQLGDTAEPLQVADAGRHDGIAPGHRRERRPPGRNLEEKSLGCGLGKTHHFWDDHAGPGGPEALLVLVEQTLHRSLKGRKRDTRLPSGRVRAWGRTPPTVATELQGNRLGRSTLCLLSRGLGRR